MAAVDQVMSLFAGIEGYLDDVPIRAVSRWEADFLSFIRERKPEIRAALERVADAGAFEIVVVDDGSTDGTLRELEEIARSDRSVVALSFRRNFGQTAAFAAGFDFARGDIVVTMDGDLQNDPADIPRLLALLDRADVVNGIRTERHDSWVRKLSSRIGNGFRNWMTGESVTDVGCSLRAMRTSYLRRVKLFRGMHRFLPTLLRIEGARLVEIPVSHRPRRHGRSKYGIGNRLFVGLVDVFAVRWMQRRVLRYKTRE
ncbi:MAG TPA: glycosyltransferase [Deltaproteobacteria bacterium]|nr:glycosyltransferase [Deltaproteobacteria bacterium]